MSLAQCPNLAQRYAQFNQISSSDSLLLKQGQGVLASWQRCGTDADSVYAKLVHTLGRAQWYAGDLVQAERLTRQALTINGSRSPLSRPANRANSYTNLGQILLAQGRYVDALGAYTEAIRVARQYPDKQKVGAIAADKQATAFDFLGDYEQAAQSAQVGYELAQHARDPMLAVRNRVQEIQAYLRLNQLTRAQSIVNETIPFARALNSPIELANVLSVAASVLRVGKRPAEAIANYEQAFALNKQANYQYGCWQTLINEAYVYQQDKQHQKALQTFTRAEVYATTPIEKALLKAYQSQSVLLQGKPQQALSMLRQALGDFGIRYPSARPDSVAIRASDKKEYLLTVLRMEADVLQSLGKQTGQSAYSTQARRTYALADYVIDLMRWEHTGQQSKLYWRETTHSLYEKAIDVCNTLNDLPGAYYFIEKSRAVMLTDKLNELGARQQLSPQLAVQEQTLNQNVSALRGQLATEKTGTPAYSRIQATLLIEQEKSDAFVRKMEQTNPQYYRYRYDNAIRPLAEVGQWLKARKQSLVSYFVGDSAVYVLGVSPSGPRLLRQPLSDYKTGLHAWLTLLNDPVALNGQVPTFTKTGNSLYELLLSPLHLPEGRVMVSPDGFFLPFEALSRSASTPDYLVNRFAFSYVYSVNRMLTDPPGLDTGGSFVGMAPERFMDTKLPDLPGSVESLKRVGDHFFWPTLLTGQTATRSAFRELAPRASVVQLFTHADADTLRREPVLYFADSLLHLSDLQTGPAFQTQLLVLSACRTGVGAHQKGEGVFSLARGFAALGVRSMLTTLWSVDSAPTYTLTELFYAGLEAGLDKDIALQRAKQDWLKTASRSGQLPNTWAGLILIGDTQPLRQSGLTLAEVVCWVGGGLLALLGLGWYIRRRRGQAVKAVPAQSGSWKPSLN